ASFESGKSTASFRRADITIFSISPSRNSPTRGFTSDLRDARSASSSGMTDIICGNFAGFQWQVWPPPMLRCLHWNIDRGQKLAEIVDFLASQRPDLVTLQEADLNAKRTHHLNIAEEIARKLEMNYVFGREFQELTQGSRNSPAFHGQATLSRWRL